MIQKLTLVGASTIADCCERSVRKRPLNEQYVGSSLSVFSFSSGLARIVVAEV